MFFTKYAIRNTFLLASCFFVTFVLKNLIHRQFPRMNAIGDADAAIAVPGEGEVGNGVEGCVYLRQNVGMTEVVLGHGIFPDENAADEWFGGDAEGFFDFVLGDSQ